MKFEIEQRDGHFVLTLVSLPGRPTKAFDSVKKALEEAQQSLEECPEYDLFLQGLADGRIPRHYRFFPGSDWVRPHAFLDWGGGKERIELDPTTGRIYRD